MGICSGIQALFMQKSKKLKKKEIDDYVFSDDDDDDGDSLNDSECDEIENENVDAIDDEDEVEQVRRIRYKTFVDRQSWIKSLGNRKKIRRVTKHDVEQYHNKKFFRDLCLYSMLHN